MTVEGTEKHKNKKPKKPSDGAPWAMVQVTYYDPSAADGAGEWYSAEMAGIPESGGSAGNPKNVSVRLTVGDNSYIYELETTNGRPYSGS